MRHYIQHQPEKRKMKDHYSCMYMQWGRIPITDLRNGKWKINHRCMLYAMRWWHERLSLTSWRVEELRCGDGCRAVDVVSSRQHIEEAGGNCFGAAAAAATWVEYIHILTPQPWRKKKKQSNKLLKKQTQTNYSKTNNPPPTHPTPKKGYGQNCSS